MKKKKATDRINWTDVQRMREAIGEAELWRGAITGDGDAEDEFDARIARYRQTLAKMSRMAGRRP